MVLSGVLRRRDVSWRRIGALNDRFDWVNRASTVKMMSEFVVVVAADHNPVHGQHAISR